MSFPPSLLVYFDASVLYGPDNATPVSGAVGVVVEEGTTVEIERSIGVDAVASSTELEFRALAEAAAAVDRRFDRVSSVHLHGDAEVVVRAADPDDDTEPPTRIARRRVEMARAALADVPTVTYRAVSRAANERAHELAREGHGPEDR